MLPRRTQRTGQRIAWPRRPLEVRRAQANALRLQKHAVATALDVKRSAVRAAAAGKGHDGIGGGLCLAVCAGLLERLPGTDKPRLERTKRSPIGSHNSRGRLQCRGNAFKLRILVLKGAAVFLNAGQLHPRRGEVCGGSLAHSRELLAPPDEVVPGQFQFLLKLFAGLARLGRFPVLG